MRAKNILPSEPRCRGGPTGRAFGAVIDGPDMPPDPAWVPGREPEALFQAVCGGATRAAAGRR